MSYKKMFFPIGGGNELEERIYGALLVAKYFNTNLEVLKCGPKSDMNVYKNLSIPEDILKKIDEVIDGKYEVETAEFLDIFTSLTKKLDITISNKPLENEASSF